MKQTKAWQVFDIKQRAIAEGAMWKAAGNKVIIRKVKERAYPGKIFWGVFVYKYRPRQQIIKHHAIGGGIGSGSICFCSKCVKHRQTLYKQHEKDSKRSTV